MARHRGMVSPINSIKHIINRSITGIASGTILNLTIAEGVVAPAVATTSDVIQGAIIKAVYFELWYVGSGTTGNVSAFTLTIERLMGGMVDQTFTQSQNLSAYTNKKNILYTTQALNSSRIDGANPVPMVRGWVKIPKGKQRIGLDDKIMINISSIGSGDVCGIFLYKEYR